MRITDRQILARVTLKESEITFIHSLAYGEPLTVAARSAGYSASHARAVLNRPHVHAALEALQANITAILEQADHVRGREEVAA